VTFKINSPRDTIAPSVYEEEILLDVVSNRSQGPFATSADFPLAVRSRTETPATRGTAMYEIPVNLIPEAGLAPEQTSQRTSRHGTHRYVPLVVEVQ